MYDLMSLIRKNQNTAFGKKYHFAEISSVSDFQKQVPVLTYDSFAPFIKKIADGEKNVLTAEDVLILEPSSGSTSASKLIPYTASLKKEFFAGLTPWLEDLAQNFKGIFDGEVYFSITPPITQRKTTMGGIPIGFESDSDYLGDYAGKMNFVVPQLSDDMGEFMDNTLKALKCAKDLRFISIWNPTFLLLLLEGEENPQDIFPNLRVISCWADGNAKPYADKLRMLFPDVYIQPKGLLATEGIMTIPIEGVGKRLANSHFFEFQSDESGDNRIYLSDELEVGKSYDIIITTAGGFYRYKIGDLVKYNGDNCFDFIGKSGNVSDLFGEKLNEQHVKRVIEGEGFRLLVPTDDRYILYADEDVDKDSVERGLRENFHYDYCRNLGQLKELEVIRIKNAERQYIDNQLRFGMKLGDIKPQYLSNRKGWVFR